MIFLWILIGIVLGGMFIGAQWITLKQLKPESSRPIFLQIFFGGIFRWLLTGIVLFLAFKDEFNYGLAALGAFWLTRSILLGIIGLRLPKKSAD
jgi:hypothetical protein